MGDQETLDRLLERHGRTYADELGIRLTNDPEPLFRMLVGALLMSARISSDIATAAGRALFDAGLTTPRAMCDATWRQRVTALGRGGYVRYDESTATYLGDTSQLLLDDYDGDLRQLRDRADRDLGRIRKLVKECKGIGDVGVDILFRELQLVWDELHPFVDDTSLSVARDLGLADDADELASLVERDRLPTLLAALVRSKLAKDLDAVRGEVADPPLTQTQRATMTKDELYAVAQDRGLDGRSEMTRDELAEGLA